MVQSRYTWSAWCGRTAGGHASATCSHSSMVHSRDRACQERVVIECVSVASWDASTPWGA
eukprot:6969604-Prymnesium_polylepis.2